MRSVRAGKLRESVVFETPSGSVTDAYGNQQTGWTALCTRKADIREVSGKERIENGVQSGVVPSTIRIRSDSTTTTITTADRATFRGHVWNITSAIALDAKSKLVEITAQRGVAV